MNQEFGIQSGTEERKTEEMNLDHWKAKVVSFLREIASIEELEERRDVAQFLLRSILGEHSALVEPVLEELRTTFRTDRGRGRNGSNTSQSSDESSDDYESRKKKSHKHRKIRFLYSAARIVKPLPFILSEGRHIEEFLKEFEDYASQNCGTDKRKWLIELNGLMKGSALATYKALNTGKIPYERVVEKLKQWYEERVKDKREDGLTSFSRAKLKNGESPYLFALRLESLADEVKLGSRSEVEGILVQKFLDEVPKTLRKRIKERINYKQRMGHGKDQSIWNIVREMLADEESSDDNLDTSYGYKAQPPPTPIDVYWGEEIAGSRSETPRMKSYSDAVRTQHVNRPNMPMLNTANRSLSQPLACEYCNRPRHTFETCRRRLGLCLICGSDKHLMRNCPDRRSQGNAEGVETKKCYKCGKPGHIRPNCPERSERESVTMDTLVSWKSDILGAMRSMLSEDQQRRERGFEVQGGATALNPHALNFAAPNQQGGVRSS